MPAGYRKSFGAGGEQRASDYLESRGFTIVEKNFYAGRSGEIDLVALKGSLLLIVEVKARSSEKFGGGIYSITASKKRRLKSSAKIFLTRHPDYNSGDFTIRFDLLIVRGEDIEWVEDIIR